MARIIMKDNLSGITGLLFHPFGNYSSQWIARKKAKNIVSGWFFYVS